MLKLLAPKKTVQNIHEINLDELLAAGIKGVITDLDNTLVETREPYADELVADWFRRLKSAGLKVVIVSNNNYERVAKFSGPLSIPFVHRARKPGGSGFRRSLRLLGLHAHETAVIGDQILTDVLGGNRLGMMTILVQPCSRKGEKIFTRFNRAIEKLAIRRLRKRGLFPREEKR